MKTGSDRGQVLVVIALSLLALVAVVALAVDGGNAYRERRALQNAADAGALAGAYELCYPSEGADATAIEASAIAAATDYAITRNGADGATVTVSMPITVSVEATKTVATYFAGVIGFRQIDVRAEAAAACGKAISAGLVWPIGFEELNWPGEDVCETEDEGDDWILLWEDGKADCEVWNCCALYEKTGSTPRYQICLPDWTPTNLPLDGRTWLDFSAGLGDSEDPCDQSGCGQSELQDRILGFADKEELVPCQSFLDLEKCVPGDSGVKTASWTAAGERIGDIAYIPLYDPAFSGPKNDEGVCLLESDLAGSACGGEVYWLTDFGCAEIDGPYYLRKLEDPENNGPRVILVHIPCDAEGGLDSRCSTSTGSTGGVIPESGDVTAISLVK